MLARDLHAFTSRQRAQHEKKHILKMSIFTPFDHVDTHKMRQKLIKMVVDPSGGYTE
jgi:hypothetical protein